MARTGLALTKEEVENNAEMGKVGLVKGARRVDNTLANKVVITNGQLPLTKVVVAAITNGRLMATQLMLLDPLTKVAAITNGRLTATQLMPLDKVAVITNGRLMATQHPTKVVVVINGLLKATQPMLLNLKVGLKANLLLIQDALIKVGLVAMASSNQMGNPAILMGANHRPHGLKRPSD